MAREVVVKECGSLDEFIGNVSDRSHCLSGNMRVVLKATDNGHWGADQHAYGVEYRHETDVADNQVNVVLYDGGQVLLDSKHEISEWTTGQLEYLQKELHAKMVRTDMHGKSLKVYSAKDSRVKASDS